MTKTSKNIFGGPEHNAPKGGVIIDPFLAGDDAYGPDGSMRISRKQLHEDYDARRKG